MEDTNQQVLTAELSQEEISTIETTCEELASKYRVAQVYPYVGIAKDTNERVIGFIKEPSFPQKVFAMDKIANVGMFAASVELMEALTLKEESDPRTYGLSSDCDTYRLGMAGACVPIIKVSNNAFKKK